MICDSHIHSSDNIENAFRTFSVLSDIGVERANILSVTWNEFPLENNITSLYFRQTYKKIDFRAFAGLYHCENISLDFYSQAKLFLDMGFDGIKLLEMKPNYRKITGYGINHKSYDRMFDYLEEQQAPVWAHIADPRHFWDKESMTEEMLARGWFYGDGTFLSRDSVYRETFERLNKNPKLRLTFCHFGFLSDDIDKAAELLESYPNLSFDITPGWEIFVDFAARIDEWQGFFEKYGDRIYFGTDSNCHASQGYLQKLNKTVYDFLTHDLTEFEMPHKKGVSMRGLDLSNETAEKILFKNYENQFRKSVFFNKELFKEHFDEIYSVVSEFQGNEKRIDMLNKIRLDLSL